MAGVSTPLDADRAAAIVRDLRATRRRTEELAAPLAPEDQVVQSMPDVSPTKWHRAHTTWFFETFVLGPHLPGYRPVHAAYGYLFNSYYEQVGDRHPRPQRGLISRPTCEEVGEYRAAVDRSLDELLDTADEADASGRAAAARARHPARAAAPGAAPDGHQARVLVQPAAAGLPPRDHDDEPARSGAVALGAHRARADHPDRPPTATASRSTTKGPATTCSSTRSTSPTAS